MPAAASPRSTCAARRGRSSPDTGQGEAIRRDGRPAARSIRCPGLVDGPARVEIKISSAREQTDAGRREPDGEVAVAVQSVDVLVVLDREVVEVSVEAVWSRGGPARPWRPRTGRGSRSRRRSRSRPAPPRAPPRMYATVLAWTVGVVGLPVTAAKTGGLSIGGPGGAGGPGGPGKMTGGVVAGGRFSQITSAAPPSGISRLSSADRRPGAERTRWWTPPVSASPRVDAAQIDPLAVEGQLETRLRAAHGEGSRSGTGGARAFGSRLDRLAGCGAGGRRGRPRGLGLRRRLRVRQGGAQPGDLPLHLRAAGGRDPIAAVAQIAGERLDRLDGVAERDVRLADIEEDGELRADGVRGVELPQRPLVTVLASELQPFGIVSPRLAAGVVGVARPAPVRAPTAQRASRRSSAPSA